MANFIKQAALAFGRFTGICRTPEQDPHLTLIQPVQALDEVNIFSDTTDALEQSATDLPPLDAPGIGWGDALSLSETAAQSATDPEAAIATGELSAVSVDTFAPAPDQPVEMQPFAAPAMAVAELPPVAIVEEIKPPIELKPEQPARPRASFSQLYELISAEVNKRADHSIAAYERLLSATHDELDAARKANRVAWSVGGVMTAVAALGAVWAAGEVSATHVELGNLRQQVVAGQQASLERDQLRANLLQTREASAKLEVDAIKSRLDQALTVSNDRDRLRAAEYENLRKAKQEIETELKLARAAAATQPVSLAQPAASKVLADRTPNDKAAGSERPDVWSTLLNGRDDR